MKVIAYTALRYGRDYLAYAIQSIIDFVDEYHVLYALTPSHGHYDPTPCPETREELYAIASTVAGQKLRWHDGQWAHEGLQRDSIYQYAPDADVILVLDADEIWDSKTFDMAMRTGGHVRAVRIPLIHYWRSFYKAVIHDPAAPPRVIFPRIQDLSLEVGLSLDYAIQHMGYAQRPEIVDYKLRIHGHKNELRSSVDEYMNTIFLPNRQHDTHPVGSEHWNPETVDPWLYMPAFMKSHPYAKLEVIE